MKRILPVVLVLLIFVPARSQTLFDADTVTPKQFDYGKMWTFDNPPLEYFAQTYQFNPDQEWMKKVRLSSLRLSSGCSASFISPEGLIMTNHHCTRSAAVLNAREGEDVVNDGFLASDKESERKLEGFFADQLVNIEDITDKVKALQKEGMAEDDALESIREEYAENENWEGLVLQTLTFYSGGKYSLYGFKRYSDIRLVFLPEETIGFFGGDPDNFTYPRYDLDCAFLRAYDENGNPFNSTSHYFRFNPSGIKENEPVFVVGNPGSTGRYRTMSQLEYDKNKFVPIRLELFRTRMNILREHNSTLQSDSVNNVIFSLSNAEKSYSGRLKGLYDPYIITRKTKLEEQNRNKILTSQTEGTDYWAQISENSKKLEGFAAEAQLLSSWEGFPVKGKTIILFHKLAAYRNSLEKNDTERTEEMSKQIRSLVKNYDQELETALFAAMLGELQRYSEAPTDYINKLMAGRSPAETAASMVPNSKLFDPEELEQVLGGNPKKYDKLDDPLINVSRIMMAEYLRAAQESAKIQALNKDLEEKIMNLQFSITGAQSPPDATFSLRIADGVVKGYDYNGTEAAYQTTYFGMYERYHANNGEPPWALPDRWLDPPVALLSSPLNFVANYDTIGGNSGSPVVNRDLEVVGLNFDSTIERLPVRNILYDPQFGRSVGVHAGGIAAALEHIYNANRLLKELDLKN